jgi:putative tryptophan/tyrosine transport system substrate-binding protein
MKRRQFIAGLGATAAAWSAIWPLEAHAQQPERMRHIGVLSPMSEDDAETRSNLAAFAQALVRSGWIDGRNIAIAYRWSGGDNGRLRAAAAELVSQMPDVIVTAGTPTTAVLQQLTNTIPIVFERVADPVTTGFVAGFPRPGGNITGFAAAEFSFGGKWLSILKDIAPGTSRVMFLYSPEDANWSGYLRALEAAAQSLAISLSPAPVSTADEIAGRIESFAREPDAGMIVQPSFMTTINRETIAALAVRHRLPAVYAIKQFVTSGGLASCGAENNDLWRRTAEYVDRILRGEKPADLPVQAPIKFEFVLNLKAAKAIGLTVPTSVQVLADEVIE